MHNQSVFRRLCGKDMLLLLPPDTFERFSVGFLIHEATGVCLALHVTLILRVVGLGPVAHCSVSVSVTRWWICGHTSWICDCLVARLPRRNG